MSRSSLDEQIAAGKRLLRHVGDEYDNGERALLGDLWRTLVWMGKNKQALQLAAALIKDDAVSKVVEAFPDATIVRASKIEVKDEHGA